MVENITEITEKRNRWVKANKENNFESGLKRLLTNLYPDNAHFIYELLQNAEDAHAKEVRFTLQQDRIEFEHDGNRLFSLEDVEAITSIGFSTKKDDTTNIGKFGVGFKAVFAYTDSPKIESGEFHFRIHDLVVPEVDGLSKRPSLEEKTRFIIPFNNPKKPRGNARTEIEKLLRALDATTILFLTNIQKIEYQLPDSSSGYIERIECSSNRYEISVQQPGELVPSSTWFLKFDKEVQVKGEEDESEAVNTCHIAVAFGLSPVEKRSSSKKQKEDFASPENPSELEIVPMEPGRVCIYFPADKEVSNLLFHIHAPFASTVARDSVRDCLGNNTLRDHLAELLTESIPIIRDQGLLNIRTLAVLPNDKDNLPKFYKPLLDTVVESFKSKKLVPTDDGKFASAQNVLQGPVALRDVITSSELAFLEEAETVFWAKGVSQNTRPDQFLKSLNIRQWSYKELQNALESKYGGDDYDQKDIKWIEKRPDNWLEKLYILLGDALSKGECNERTLQQCRIIRVIENKTIDHIVGKKAYFPKEDHVGLPLIIPAILKNKTEQQNKKIEKSLVALGVKLIDDEEHIDIILRKFYREDSPHVKHKKHLNHMRQFIKYWKEENSVEKFSDKYIFRTTGDRKMKESSSCYLDTPLMATDLNVIYKEPRKDTSNLSKFFRCYDTLLITRAFFNEREQDITGKYKLSKKYRDLNNKDFCDFAIACGVVASMPIVRQSCEEHYKKENLQQGRDGRKGRRTATAIDEDYIIPEMIHLLILEDIDINRLIWNTLCKADSKILTARFRPNKEYDIREEKSTLVHILAVFSWVPDKEGTLHKPAKITQELLPSSFQYDNRNGWLTAIGFAEESEKATLEYRKKKESAIASGLTMENFEYLNSLSTKERTEANAEFNTMLKKKERAKEAETLKKQQETVPFHQGLDAAFRQNTDPISLRSSTSETGTSQNPERRRDKLGKEISSDIGNEPSSETRFAFKSIKKWKGKNKDVREKLRQWYGGKCQICGETFPQHNGEPYFEGLYLVSHTKAEWIDRSGNVLCLCPLHSAMFQHGSKQVDTDIASQVLAFVPQKSGGNKNAAISLTLCRKDETIKFHEDHLIELQVMIQESLKAEDTP